MIIRIDEKLIGYPTGYHFAVLETPVTDHIDGTIKFDRQIVIKNGDNIMIEGGLTNFASYVHPYDKKWTRAKTPTQQELVDVCAALNFFGTKGIQRFSDIDQNMVEEFFDYYRDRPVSGQSEHFVNDATLSLCVKTVASFLGNLYKDGIVSIPPEALMEARYLKSHYKHKEELKYVPKYHRSARKSEPSSRVKYMPVEVVDMLIALAEIYYPMVTFAFTLQKDGGFRESEVMNVRQIGSPVSERNGIQYIRDGTKLSYFGIDLTREFVLRSDNVNVGLIKRDASDYSPVYEKNLESVWNAYQKHLVLLESTPYEKEYCPMFVNSRGLAMTRQNYCYCFDQLVKKHLQPELLKSHDPRLVSFGQLLLDHPIGPHVFRHFFTVKLVLENDKIDVATVMTYRGDRNPSSALAYLQGKDLFKQALESTNSLCVQGLTSVGSYIYDNY